MCNTATICIMKKAFEEWLNNKFFEWEMNQGERKNISEFAEYLNVSPGALGHWMNGLRQPTGDNVERIAGKLGPQIYDFLGLARPDPQLQELTSIWHQLDQSVKHKILNLAKNNSK